MVAEFNFSTRCYRTAKLATIYLHVEGGVRGLVFAGAGKSNLLDGMIDNGGDKFKPSLSSKLESGGERPKKEGRMSERPLQHIAAIMDGNGRWARARGLPRIEGHRAGAEAVRSCVEGCQELGVEWLTLYAFSSENWSRPRAEVNALMMLLERFLKERTQEMLKRGVRLHAIGRLEKLPERCRAELQRAIELTANNRDLNLVLALSYGGREEIVESCKRISRKVELGEIRVADIDERYFEGHLDTVGIPDPDLVIRTSGEMRLSNFLLWQLSYAELFILNKNWPDFSKTDLHQVADDYRQRHRRFGLV